MTRRDSERAHIPVKGAPFNETLSFFVDELAMRMTRISPADDPSMAIVEGHGLTLRIDKSSTATPTICVESGAAPSVTAPNGVEIQFVDRVSSDAAIHSDGLPARVDELVVTNASSGAPWVTGRAGMRYRDLIPSRLGGRYIASHIEVCDGGPVPDLVHHHAIRFQMIFCHRGWVDVVYEDQGDQFRMEAGDCVLQPPHIRHRVLASSAGAQVVEIGCPAEHDTFFDYDLELPTAHIDHDRDFGGQRFVRHQGSVAPWKASDVDGFDEQVTGIRVATDGLATVRVLRPADDTSTAPATHEHDFHFLFVLDGSTVLNVDDSTSMLEAGDSVAIPAGMPWQLSEIAVTSQLLEVVVY